MIALFTEILELNFEHFHCVDLCGGAARSQLLYFFHCFNSRLFKKAINFLNNAKLFNQNKTIFKTSLVFFQVILDFVRIYI